MSVFNRINYEKEITMATIKEDYVSFETAKLLKGKGFDEYCSASYNLENGELSRFMCHCYGDNRIQAPTLQLTMKWLREEKNILIYVYPVIDLPVKNNYTFYWRWDGKKKRHDAPHIGDKHNYESFEQAVEAAIKYCLEHLI